MPFTREQVEAAVKGKGYAWFDNRKDYNVNIVGIRNSAPGNKVSNVFDDWMTISYRENGQWVFKQWKCTTDPGAMAVQHYHNPNGIARLVPGQYRKSHKIDLHRGKYPALCNQRPVKVYRDKNKDLMFDESTIDEGVFGINIHRATPVGTVYYVENFSEGCQVFSNTDDFAAFMQACYQARNAFGNDFTYTLLESKDMSAS